MSEIKKPAATLPGEVARSCATCRFSQVQYAPPPSIQKVRGCKRFPPVAIAMQGPQGFALGAAWPIVNDEHWCYEWTAEEAANTLIRSS